jgi:hypothetical protein
VLHCLNNSCCVLNENGSFSSAYLVDSIDV